MTATVFAVRPHALSTRLQGRWSGADLERLLGTWPSVDVQLVRLGDDLTALSAAVRRNAAEQDTTSNAGTGGSSVPPGFVPPAGPGTPNGPDLDGDGRISPEEQQASNSAMLRRRLGIGPDLIHSGDGRPWTPQGQGYDEFRDQFLTSYYGEDGVRLSIQDKGSGYEVGNVILEGMDGEKLNHGGGVSTDGTFVYVADGGHVLV